MSPIFSQHVHLPKSKQYSKYYSRIDKSKIFARNPNLKSNEKQFVKLATPALHFVCLMTYENAFGPSFKKTKEANAQ